AAAASRRACPVARRSRARRRDGPRPRPGRRLSFAYGKVPEPETGRIAGLALPLGIGRAPRRDRELAIGHGRARRGLEVVTRRGGRNRAAAAPSIRFGAARR